mgnify:CR=1 FL=1
MTKKFVKQLLMAVFALMLVCVPAVTANAAQMEETTEDEEFKKTEEEMKTTCKKKQ